MNIDLGYITGLVGGWFAPNRNVQTLEEPTQQNEEPTIEEPVQPKAQASSRNVDTLRPKNFSDFIGEANRNVVERLELAVASAVKRNATLNHILLYGNQGLGKTTLSKIIATEAGAEIVTVTGSTLLRQQDILLTLCKVEQLASNGKPVVLFIDEIHDLRSKDAPETLWYPILEEFTFYHNLEGTQLKMDGNTYSVSGSVVKMKPFTVIGATTDPGKLSPPLRDRFQINCSLKAYSIRDLKDILLKYAHRAQINVEREAFWEVARRGRGNPRISINLLLACYDRAVVKSSGKILSSTVLKQMSSDGIDEEGLLYTDIAVLTALKAHPKGLGLGNLASSCGIRKQTIEEMVEPVLKLRGYMMTTHKRFITESGVKLLEKKGMQ